MVDPHTGKDLISGGFIQELEVCEGRVTFKMVPPDGEDHCPQYVPLAVEVKRKLKTIPGVTKVSATLTCHMQARAVNEALELMDEKEDR